MKDAKEQKPKMYQRSEKSKNLIQFDDNGCPFCEKHGAMNCVSETRTLWRCLTCGVGISFPSSNLFDLWLRIHRKNDKFILGR